MCLMILLSSFAFCCIIKMQLLHYVVLGLIVDNIHDVHSLVMMHSTYVRSNVGRVSRAIWTIRTTESRHLATLKFQMLVQIILSRENVATFVARILFASLVILHVLVTIEITRMTRYWITNTCEQKRFYQITTSNFHLVGRQWYMRDTFLWFLIRIRFDCQWCKYCLTWKKPLCT